MQNGGSSRTDRNAKIFAHKNYAHRGLYDLSAGIPENSIPAFEAAVRDGYGVELDVQFSKDGQVVVFHDDLLDRVCGIEGYVKDYDYVELSQMKLSGTNETIPLFSEVLSILERGTGYLVCEIKDSDRLDELCQKTYDLLRDSSVTYCVESFNPKVAMWFKRNAPEVVRGLLSAPAGFFPGLSRRDAKIIETCATAFISKPDFIAYKIEDRPERVIKRSRRKGRMIIAWTSTTPGEDQRLNDAVIFEGYRPGPEY